jgi:hypothetical protein
VFLADDTEAAGSAGGKPADTTQDNIQQAVHGGHQQCPALVPGHNALSKQQQLETPALLAIRLRGAPTAVDWLDPGTGSGLSTPRLIKPPISAADGPAAVGEGVQAGTVAGGFKVPHLPTTTAKSALISCQHLCLSSYDATNGLWVATAPDTAVVSAIKTQFSSSRWGARVKELGKWAAQQQQLLSMAQQRVQLLVNGS